MAENEKAKASKIARIASTFSFLYVLFVAIGLFMAIFCLVDNSLTGILGWLFLILAGVFMLPFGLTALILGIIGISLIKRGEGLQSAWGAGTKGQALTAIIVPPALLPLVIGAGFFFFCV